MGVNMMTRKQVELIGDPPSNSFRSKYTDICNLVTRIENSPNDFGGFSNFFTPTEQQLVFALKAKIDEFQASSHARATSVTELAKKDKEKRAVAQLAASMEDDISFAKLSKVLTDNANSPIPLVRNSVAGWVRRLGRGWSLVISNQQGINAQWGNTSLQFKPAALFKLPHPFPISIVVHEYHHVLSERADPLYNDEFVAHWKQYLVGEPQLDDAGREARVNRRLITDGDGYHCTPPKTLRRPEDAGPDFWDKTLNNVG